MVDSISGGGFIRPPHGGMGGEQPQLTPQQVAWENVSMMLDNSQNEPGNLDLEDSVNNLYGSVVKNKPIDKGALSNMVNALTYFINQYQAACPTPIPQANQNVLDQLNQALQEFQDVQLNDSLGELSTAINTYEGGLYALQQAGPPPGSIPPPPSMR
jgi:hypothetical protein